MLRNLVMVSVVAAAGGLSAAAAAQDQQDKPKKSAAELMREVAEAVQNGELEAAVKLGTQALELEPENRQYLVAMAQICTQYGVEMAATDRKKANEPLRQGAKYMRTLAKLKKDLSRQEQRLLSITIYNEACCYAIDGEKEQAYKLLRESIASGFRELDILQNDEDFDSIRDTDEFKKIVKELQDKIDTDK